VGTRGEVGEYQTVEASGRKRHAVRGRTSSTCEERSLEWRSKDLACLKGSVESVVGKGGPRPSVASTRRLCSLPHNILISNRARTWTRRREITG